MTQMVRVTVRETNLKNGEKMSPMTLHQGAKRVIQNPVIKGSNNRTKFEFSCGRSHEMPYDIAHLLAKSGWVDMAELEEQAKSPAPTVAPEKPRMSLAQLRAQAVELGAREEDVSGMKRAEVEALISDMKG